MGVLDYQINIISYSCWTETNELAKRWLDANNFPGYLKDYKWEYNLVEDETVNAWCMPGGKIVFYTGIMPIASSETGVAAIMGHEVAHALANHGQQRMSAGLLQQAGAAAGNFAFKDDKQRERHFYSVRYRINSRLQFLLDVFSENNFFCHICLVSSK